MSLRIVEATVMVDAIVIWSRLGFPCTLVHVPRCSKMYWRLFQLQHVTCQILSNPFSLNVVTWFSYVFQYIILYDCMYVFIASPIGKIAQPKPTVAANASKNMQKVYRKDCFRRGFSEFSSSLKPQCWATCNVSDECLNHPI